MSPSLVTIFLFQFVGIWNNFFLPLVMLSESALPDHARPRPVAGPPTGSPSSTRTVGGASLSVVPLMILFVVLQRFWRTGLTEGSVKASST